MDGSDANAAAIKSDNVEHGTASVIRQVKDLHKVHACVQPEMRAALRLHRALPWPPHALPHAGAVLSINQACLWATEPDKRRDIARPVLLHERQW